MIFLFDYGYHFVHQNNHLNDMIKDQYDSLLVNYLYLENYYLFDDDYYYENGRTNLNRYKDDIDLNNYVDKHNLIQIKHFDHNQLMMI